MTGTAPPPLPEGFGVALDPATDVRDGGRVLVGGSPLRLVRLSDAGAAAVRAWARGGRPSGDSQRALARRLCDVGIAHPLPPPAPAAPGEVEVVVPVRDRPVELRGCLLALGRRHPVLVVDDGSRDPAAVRDAAAAAGARVVRREAPGGPAAARNTGLAATTAPLVAFVDSDCLPPDGWLDPLVAHLRDPAVGAAAPRIVAATAERDGWLARYEHARSALDLGGAGGYVGPGRRVAYLPAAALVVRRAAAGDGFRAGMHVGEDVDLVWRLVEGGWRVRYEPTAEVAHRHRVQAAAFLRRRFDYGTSAAPLARRHPGRLPAVSVNPWSAAAWALLVDGRPLPAAGVAAVTAGLLGRKLDGRVGAPYAVAARLAGRGTWGAGRLLASATTRSWLPVAAAAAVPSRRVRGGLAAAVLVPALLEWRTRRPALDPLRWTAAALLDDAAYCAGVWAGCLAERTAEPLLPSWRAGKVADLLAPSP